MRSAWLLVAAALTALLTPLPPWPAEARADECTPIRGLSPCIDADNLWPHAGGGPFFAIGSTATTPSRQISFGLVGSFLTEPLGVTVASPDPKGSTIFVVDKLLDATLLFAVGITDRLELTLAAPAALYQEGGSLSGIVAGGAPSVRSAVRDLRFGFALAMITRPRPSPEPSPRGFALTGRFEMGVPVGTKSAFAGASTATFAPSLVLDYRWKRLTVAAEAFARLRGTTQIANAAWGSQVGGALGAAVDMLWDRWLTLGAEAFALPTPAAQGASPFSASGTTGTATPTATTSAPPLAPAEWIAEVSTAHLLGGALVFSLGGGSSIPLTSHGAITAPQYRLDFGLRYAPTGEGHR
jgi:hypothetical protein